LQNLPVGSGARQWVNELLWRRLYQASKLIKQAFGTNASGTTKDQHGKTKRTRTFPKPQSASCLERKIKSETEAAAYAGEEKSLDCTPH
jgi:hypothetical protein